MTIPPPSGSTANGNPTGQVSNNTNDFLLSNGGGNGAKASFLFATLNGTVAGWNSGTIAATQVTTTGATYTGLAIDHASGGNLLLAANSRGGANNGIDVFNASFAPVSLGANAFKVPNLAAGLTPYNVAELNSTIYVTYSQRNQPTGFVAAFDRSGNFLQAIGSNAPAGTLDAPWGLTIAPTSFGQFANALLVGNFGDPTNGGSSGTIDAFDPNNGSFLGQLLQPNGTPFAEPGLWSLLPGNGGNGGDPDKLYFSAGINSEADGLFGSLTAVPEPSSGLQAALAIIVSSLAFVLRCWRYSPAPATPAA